MASCGEMSTGFDVQMFRELTQEPQIVQDTDDENVEKIEVKPDVSLADGMPLPKYLRNDFPDQLFGKPIHEIDPFYDNKNTFVVIGTNWVIHRFSSLKSLWLLTPLNRLRWFCYRTITHWAFRIFMIITVIAYTIFYHQMNRIEWHMPFLTIFAVEMNLKIIAHGFLLQPFSYLRNPWNWIDFILTQVGLTLGFVARYLHPIHSLRILRLIHFFTHSRLTCSWMFRSLLRMKDPLLYGMFLFLFFTIYAQQFFAGVLSNRCIQETLVYRTTPMIYHNVTFVAPGPLNLNVTEIHFIKLPYVCGNATGSRACPDDFVCSSTLENPDNGYTSFDNFLLAGLSIMRLMARDFWDGLYMQIHSAIGPREFPFILTVMVYGGYYYVNLLLAYIAVGITELLQILEGKKNKNERKVVKPNMLKSDDVETSKKEKASTGIEEKDLAQAIDFPLINIDASNHSNEGESDAIVLECVSTAPLSDPKHQDFDEEKGNAYQPRRSPLSSFCMPLADRFCDWNCCPCWVGFQEKLKVVVLNVFFEVFIGLCIVLNIVTMALYHHNIALEFAYVLHMCEFIFMMVFVVEAVLKILALSPRHYFKDSLNRLDFFIAVTIIFEIVTAFMVGFSIFRMFRVLRIFRLMRWWPYFSDLTRICRTNTWALCIVSFTFAKVAEGIFKYHYVDGDFSHSRWNFRTSMNSLVTVFRLICGEFIEPLWECLPGNNSWYCIPYFFTIIIVGNLALFTLFVTMLAVALNSSDLSETEPVHDHNFISIIKNFLSFLCCSRFWRPKRLDEQTAEKSREELFNMSADEEAKASGGGQLTRDCDVEISPHQGFTTAASATTNHTPFWSTWENFRSSALGLIRNKYFEYGMTTFIILSCLSQAWNDNELDNVYLHTVYYVMNYFVIIIYPLEICLQILGYGFKIYFTKGWHIFDFVITVVHIISMMVIHWTGVFLPPFGFRPLKLIPRLTRLRVVVSATLDKLSSLLDVLLACGILWLFFAVLGVQLFGGRFYSCVSDSGLPVVEVDNKSDCLSNAASGSNISWQQASSHFDDVGSAFVALMHVASMRGWITVMHSAFDSSIPDMQPIQEINMGYSLYFIAFFILGVLCSFTFVLATFLRKSNDQRKQVGGYIEILMTEDQRKEFTRKKATHFISPVKVSPCPEWRPRRFAYQIVFSSKFKLMVILLTSFNAFALCLISLHTSELMVYAIADIDVVFFLVFVLEVLLRTAAFGRSFFTRHWNIYDFVVLVMSVFVYTLHPFFPHYLPSPVLFVLLRIVRLVRWLKWVRRIASRLMLYLTALNNVAVLLLVVITTYASMMFVMYRHGPFVFKDTDHVDLAHFGSALLCVAMMGFGSSWEGVIETYEGSRWFFISFLAIFYLFLFEAGAVLFLEHYHLLNERRRTGLTDDALEAYETAWKILDPNATGYIACDHLSEFLHAMLPPLQIAKPNLDQIAVLDVPIYKDDNVAFNDVLLALLDRLDDREKFVKTEAQNRGDIISSTLKRQQEDDAKRAEQELAEN